MKQIPLNQNPNFTVNEVVQLINRPVVRHDRTVEFKPENIGLIVGVLTLNEEVEMVVKFIDRVTQFTKTEFAANYRVIKD